MKLLLRLLTLYRPYWPWLLLGFMVALATVIANIALIAISGWFITAMAIAGVSAGTLNYFTPAALIRACAVIRTGGRYAERLVTHEATFRLLAHLRVWLYRHIEPLPPLMLEPFHSGDLANRLRADIDRLETVYLRILNPVAVGIITVVLLLVFLTGYSPTLAVIEGAGLMIAGLLVPAAIGAASSGSGRTRVKLATAVTESAIDSVNGMGELLVFDSAGRAHRDHFLALSNQFITVQKTLSRLAGLSQSAHLLTSNLAMWGAVVVMIPLVRADTLNDADFVMLMMLALAGFEAVAPLPAAVLAWSGARESAKRVFALTDSLGTPPDTGPDTGRITVPPQRCDLRVRDLSFSYHPDSPPVLSGFSLDLPQGSRVALIGPMGTGKSTVVSLLTGLHQIPSGIITVAGHDIGDYETETLRRCFAVSPQGQSLFTGTIRDALHLAQEEAPDRDLWRVLEIAHLAETVRTLPDGLDTHIGEAGLALSGGQARRLGVARALLRPAPILILDEPGEGLDYRTERGLLTSVVNALEGRSLVLITHRAAGLEMMDQVVPLTGKGV